MCAVPATEPLRRISSAGGVEPEVVTTFAEGEVVHRWPQVVPAARGILYTAHTAPAALDSANILFQPLPSGAPKIVHRGGYHAQVLASGHLVYVQNGTLFAAPIDLDRLELTGQAVAVVEGVASSTGGGLDPTWSRTRQELLYRTPDNHIMVVSYSTDGGSFKADKPRLWSERAVLGRARYRSFDLHPDGERLAAAVATERPNGSTSDKVVFVLNFCDELRRIAPTSVK
jgi:serine/threonine-protein kinase